MPRIASSSEGESDHTADSGATAAKCSESPSAALVEATTMKPTLPMRLPTCSLASR